MRPEPGPDARESAPCLFLRLAVVTNVEMIPGKRVVLQTARVFPFTGIGPGDMPAMIDTRRGRRCGAWALIVGVLALGAAARGAAAGPQARKMTAAPPEKLTQLGSTEGMPLYPADPLPGYPGMDPDPAKKRLPRNTPQLVNYPGSIEHYTLNNGYVPKVNPYNWRTLVKNFVAADLPGVDPALREQFAEPRQYLIPGGGEYANVREQASLRRRSRWCG